MKKHWFAGALAFALIATPAFAQDEDDAPPAPSPKTKRVEREKPPAVVGRNDSLRDAFRDVAAKTSGHVVKVGSTAYGILIEGGYVVTTAAAAKGLRIPRVEGATGAGDARVLAIDEANGIALLKAPFAAEGFVLAKHEPRIGQFVITVGTSADKPLVCGVLSAKDRHVEPRDLSQANLLMGLFSDGIDGPKRAYPKVLQHDGPMTDDVLGTPLVDSSGTLVGLNVGTGYRGSSYAIGVNELIGAVSAMKEGRVPAAAPRAKKPERAPEGRPYLGAGIRERAEGGLVVDDVAEGGPAANAGLKAGDRIRTFGGATVASLDGLATMIGARKPGEKVTLGVQRGTEELELSVTLGGR